MWRRVPRRRFGRMHCAAWWGELCRRSLHGGPRNATALPPCRGHLSWLRRRRQPRGLCRSGRSVHESSTALCEGEGCSVAGCSGEGAASSCTWGRGETGRHGRDSRCGHPGWRGGVHGCRDNPRRKSRDAQGRRSERRCFAVAVQRPAHPPEQSRFPDRCGGDVVLHRRRRHPRPGAVEVGRHQGGHRPGQGHRPRRRPTTAARTP